jgi:glucose/arabinose dehydrogenase
MTAGISPPGSVDVPGVGQAGHSLADFARQCADTFATSASPRTVSAPLDLVIIDSAVHDTSQLAAGVADGAEVILLSEDRGGIEQITEILASRSNVRSLHVVSHGDPGSLQIGNETLNAETLNQNVDRIRTWSTSFAEGADVLLYGCRVGEGTVGAQFVARIAELTGTDVAASTDTTGAADQRANWDLELHVGHVDVGIAFSQMVVEQYQSVLPITIHAAGSTGEERIELQIDGQTVQSWDGVGGDYFGGDFESLTYTGPAVSADRIRVAFVNDGTTASGADRNVRVDRITIDGVDYQTEHPGVFSTGTYVDPIGCVPGFQQSEYLHCSGYFEYSSSATGGSTITIRAAGATGDEAMSLQINGQTVRTWNNVGGNYVAGQFQDFTYQAGTNVTADQIRIAFINDGSTASGADRNLRIDGITVDGVNYEAEAPEVFSTGTWIDPVGCVPGFQQSEFLHCGGYLEFSSTPSSGSTLTVQAAGSTGEETMELQIDGVTVRAWNGIGGNYDAGVFQSFTYTAAETITPDRVRVVFSNDGLSAAGADRNLRVNHLQIDGVIFETESATVLSTGTWIEGIGCEPGFVQGEFLHCGGYFDFGSGRPGVIQLATSVLEVNEAAGSISINVLRQEGSDGRMTVDYATIASSATDGSDFTGVAGTLVFADGETLKTVTVPVLQDTLQESNETFSFAIDNANGGAALRPPRTATITIRDDDTLLPSFPNFSAAQNLTRNGTATIVSNRLQLTPAVNNNVGSAFFAAPLQVDAQTSFQTSFALQIAGGQGTGGADGMAFVVQNSTAGANAIAGAAGGSLGYSGIANSLAIEFDTYQNPFDVNANHVSVLTKGNLTTPLITRSAPLDLNGGQPIFAWVDYNGNTNDLSVFMASSSVKPNAPILTTSVDLADLVGSQAYVGFTAATGGLNNTHSILNWQLNTDVPPQTEPPTPGSQLVTELVTSGLVQPTSVDWVADGTVMLIAEQRGLVRAVQNGQLLTTPFLDIRNQVNGTRDRGLLDMAVHPDFENNPYVYLLYTYDPPEVFNFASDPLAGPDRNGNRAGRLTRVTANAATGYTTAVPGSEVVLLGTNSTWQNFNAFVNSTTNFTEPPAGILPDGTNLQDFINSDSESHTVGSLDFGPGGALYVSIGDGASYNRVDPRAVRVQDIDNLSGKVLRIDPITGDGLPSNPFYEASNPDSNRSKVFQYGLRNPFRIAVDQVTGGVYVGDVGWTTWEELNLAGPGANFGWPYYEGGSGTNIRTPGYRDLPQAQAFYASGQAATPAILALNHSSDGINAIVMGDVYRGTTYPAEYVGDVFFNDLGQGIVRNVSFGANGQITSIQTFATGAQIVVQIKQGPDGNLYYVDLNDGQVGRWTFV